MRAADKFFGMLAAALVSFTSCNRMATPPAAQFLKDAEARTQSGDFLEAINLYERALDGSPRSAEIHYRLALLYDDKMHDPLNALHHFKRCLTIAPGGPHAEEVKTSMKRDELALATELSGDSLVSRAEAARLRNENLDLRRQLDESHAQARTALSAAQKPATRARHEKKPNKRSHR